MSIVEFRALPAIAPRPRTWPRPAAAGSPGRRLLRRGPAPPARLGPRAFRPDIQGLRAVAVVLVVLYHAKVPGVTGGYVGVDVFFVISGFLITGGLLREVAQRGRISLRAFYAGRIRRLLPPAVLVLLVTLVVARIWGSVFQLADTAWAAIFTTIYAMNYRLATDGVNYQRADDVDSPLQHFWSLAVEEQFYLIWPLLLILCIRAGGRRLRGTLIVGVLLAACAFSLHAAVTVTAENAPLAYFSLHTRAWELGLGALLAVVAGRLVALPRWTAVVLSWAGLGAILWSGHIYSDATPFPGTAALVPVLGTVAVIAAGCRTPAGTAEAVLKARGVQAIGRVSYGWYLWHWPMVVLVPLMYGRRFQWWENLELMALALWLAVLSYWLIESPARYSRARPGTWFRAGVGLSTSVATVAVAVLATVPPLVGGGAAAPSLALHQADIGAVQDAVGAGTRLTTAPSNLTPRLAEVADDEPRTSAEGCHLGYLAVTQSRACVFGDPAGTRTMVLTGDSHAQQWFPALDAAARKNSWRLVTWTKAACPIADVEPYNAELRRGYLECTQWREHTLAEITALRPDAVVIGQSDTVPRDEVSNVAWAEATVTSIRRLQAEAIPVVFILDSPYPGRNVAECVANNLDDVGACTSRRELVWPYAGRHEQMAQTLAAAGVTAIEPIAWFCTLRDCPSIVNGMLVYRDESHVSTPYAEWLAPMMDPLFQGGDPAAAPRRP